MGCRGCACASLMLLAFAGCGSSGPLSSTGYVRAIDQACREQDTEARAGTGGDAASRFAAVRNADEHLASRLRALRGRADLVAIVRNAADEIDRSLPLADRIIADTYAAEHGTTSVEAAARHDAALIGQADALTNTANTHLDALGAHACRQS